MTPITRASESLRSIVEMHKEASISVGQIVSGFHQRGFSLLLMIFCAPLIPPFSPPIFTLIIALPLIFLSCQMIFGLRAPWIPSWLGKKTIKTAAFAHVVKKVNPYLEKLERYLKPRFLFLSNHVGEKMIGVCCLLCSLSIATSLPFTNTIPSIAIFLMALGLLERDGLLINAGMVIMVIGLTLTCVILFLGVEALAVSWEWAKTLL